MPELLGAHRPPPAMPETFTPRPAQGGARQAEKKNGGAMKVIDPFTFLLGVMVAYRLALMFSSESGPGRIFRKLRNAAPPKSATREGLSCLHCESVWWAAPITAFFWWRGHVEPWDTPICWLAMSAGAIVIHHAFTKSFTKK